MLLLQKFRNLVRELGTYNAVLYLLDRVCQRANLPCRIHRYYFVSQPVAGPVLPARWRGKLHVARYASFAPALRALPLSDEVIAYRFDQRAQCFCVDDGAHILGCLWLCIDGYDEDEVRAHFAPAPRDETAWDFDVYIAPDHRGKLAFPRLWDEANAWLSSLGRRWSVSRISAFNRASLRVHKRMGARIVGSATFVRLARAQLSLCSLGPRVHFSPGPASRPVIKIPARPDGAGDTP